MMSLQNLEVLDMHHEIDHILSDLDNRRIARCQAIGHLAALAPLTQQYGIQRLIAVVCIPCVSLSVYQVAERHVKRTTTRVRERI